MPRTRLSNHAPRPAQRAAASAPIEHEDARAVLDALPAMVGYWDADQRNRFANRAYVEFFGLTPEEIHGRRIREVLGPDLYALNLPHIERALAGEPQLFDRTLVDPSGTPRDTQASYVPDVVNGRVRGFVALVTDITARRVAERALAAAESRFRLAFMGSPVGMGLLDGAGRLIRLNEALCEKLGYSEQQLTGRELAGLVCPDGQAEERGRIAALLAGDAGPISVERRLLCRDGTRIWAILSLALAHGDDTEEALAIVHVQDITARREAEDELKRGRGRLTEAERLAQMGSWEWDIRNDRTSWSEGLFHIYRLTPEEFDPTLNGGERRVFPEDRARVLHTLERAVADRSPFTLEYRAVRSDGRVRTLRSQGEVVVGPAGEPVRLVGFVQDITDAKLAQEALQRTSADLERRALELQELALASAPATEVRPFAPLTPRQLEILELIAQGLTNGQIAERLVVTEDTVKWHVKQILGKTAAHNRAEAVARVLGTQR